MARAQWVVSGQVGCGAEDALVLLREIAAVTDDSLDAVAELVIRGDVRFTGGAAAPASVNELAAS